MGRAQGSGSGRFHIPRPGPGLHTGVNTHIFPFSAAVFGTNPGLSDGGQVGAGDGEECSAAGGQRDTWVIWGMGMLHHLHTHPLSDQALAPPGPQSLALPRAKPGKGLALSVPPKKNLRQLGIPTGTTQRSCQPAIYLCGCSICTRPTSRKTRDGL